MGQQAEIISGAASGHTDHGGSLVNRGFSDTGSDDRDSVLSRDMSRAALVSFLLGKCLRYGGEHMLKVWRWTHAKGTPVNTCIYLTQSLKMHEAPAALPYLPPVYNRTIASNVTVKWLLPLLRIHEVPGSNLDPRDRLSELVKRLPQALHKNDGIYHKINIYIYIIYIYIYTYIYHNQLTPHSFWLIINHPIIERYAVCATEWRRWMNHKSIPYDKTCRCSPFTLLAKLCHCFQTFSASTLTVPMNRSIPVCLLLFECPHLQIDRG